MGYWVEDLLLEKSLKAATVRMALIPPSFVFWMIVRLRNYLYDHGILSVQKAPLPVISIGNVVAGGTGKTPLTHILTKALLPFCKVAIISRGYRSEAEKAKRPLLASQGNGPLFPPSVMGDEPYLLSTKEPGAIVVVGRDRLKAIQMAKEAGASICILDDGMQVRKLHRDIEIAVVDGKHPFGGGHFLPRGFLRDEPRRLQSADLIVVRGKSPFPVDETPVVETTLHLEDCVDKEGTSYNLSGRSVALFSGIAHPSRFVESVKNLGAIVTATLFCKDHGMISPAKLLCFAKQACEKGAEMLLCTEKDFVKINKDHKLPLPLVYARAELVITNSQGAWQTLLSNAITLTQRSV